MRDFLRLCGKTAVALFVVWHAFAVATFSVPREATDPIATFVKTALLPHVTPYMHATSQWQLWNLFAPDPIRRVTFYRTERRENDEWKELETIRPGTFSVFRHAANFKMLRRILTETGGGNPAMRERFLHDRCARYELSADTPIRLTFEFYVIPKNDGRMSRAWWDAWKPDMQSYVGFETVCPPRS